MPFLEFKCQLDHVTEQLFTTVSAGEKVDQIDCPQCGAKAYKIFSVPLGFGFYGKPQGYHKPSALQRHSTKLINERGNS